MKIGIDISMVTSSKAGIGYYAYSLVHGLSEVDKINTYFLFASDNTDLSMFNLSSNFKVVKINGKGNLLWMLKSLPKVLNLKLDNFISPSNLFWGIPLGNAITVVHDLAQIRHPEFFYKKGNFVYKILLNILLRKRTQIIVPSSFVRSEVNDLFPKSKAQINVISEGLHDWVLSSYTEDKAIQIEKKYNLPKHYILSVGTLEPRKNIEFLLKGFKFFEKENKDYFLVIVGKKGWFYDSIYKTVTELGIQKRVIFLGYVPEDELAVILDQSDLVACLSFYEGFGLPLIEASARNKKVLASNIPVFKELQISASFVELDSTPEELGKEIKMVLESKDPIKSDIYDIYSWKSVAKQVISLMGSTLKE